MAGKAAIPTKQGFCDMGLVDNVRVGWLAGPREVQRDDALVGPHVKIARHELAALIEADRRREARFLAGPFPAPQRRRRRGR